MQTRAEAKEAATNITKERVSNALQTYMKRRKHTVQSFTEQVLQIDGRNTVVYGWLSKRNLPSKHYIPALASALHVGRWYFTPQVAANGDAQERPVGVNGGVATVHAEPAVARLDELLGDSTPITEPLARIVRSRSPKAIERERRKEIELARKKNADELGRNVVRMWNRTYEDPTVSCGNLLSYTGNNDGTGTVTLRYTDVGASAQKVFLILAGMDAIKLSQEKMKPDLASETISPT